MPSCHIVQKRREREIQQQMESRDEETLELKETYSSLQQEVDIKTKKLKKVKRKWLPVYHSGNKINLCVKVRGALASDRFWLLLCAPVIFQAASCEGRDPWSPRRAHQGAPGNGTDPEWTHQGTKAKVSPITPLPAINCNREGFSGWRVEGLPCTYLWNKI